MMKKEKLVGGDKELLNKIKKSKTLTEAKGEKKSISNQQAMFSHVLGLNMHGGCLGRPVLSLMGALPQLLLLSMML